MAWLIGAEAAPARQLPRFWPPCRLLRPSIKVPVSLLSLAASPSFFFLLPLAWFPYRREGWWGDCSYRGESSFCEDSCLLFDSLFLYLAGGRGVPGSLFWVVGERVSEVWAGLVGWWIGWRLIKVWRDIRGATVITQCFWYLEFTSILQDVKRNVESTCSLIESSNLSHV